MNIFNISTNQANTQTWVTWPNFGVVRSTTACETLVNLAFEASPDQIGISLKTGDEHWLSSLLYYQVSGSIDELMNRVTTISPLIGIGFDNHMAATVFVDLAEKYILMSLLGRNHDEI